MLTAGSTAEIVTGDEDFCIPVRCLVQHEVRNFLLVLSKAHLVEQMLAETGTLDGLQELLGNNHVGIDIDQGQWGGDTGQLGKLLHGSFMSIHRIEVIRLIMT